MNDRTGVLIKFDAEILRQVTAAADVAGVSRTAWIRQTIASRLGIQEAVPAKTGWQAHAAEIGLRDADPDYYDRKTVVFPSNFGACADILSGRGQCRRVRPEGHHAV